MQPANCTKRATNSVLEVSVQVTMVIDLEAQDKELEVFTIAHLPAS
jgi:hypothetical protein